MFFYVVMIPALAISTVMMLYLFRATKHDEMIFRFCQIRREVVDMLRREGTDLCKIDYSHLGELLVILNSTIHMYVGYKASVYSLRSCIRYLKEFRLSASKAQKVGPINNPRILQFKVRMVRAILLSFFTYIPFTRSQICLDSGVWFLEHVAKPARLRVEIFLDFLLFVKELRARSRELQQRYSSLSPI